MNFKKMLVTLMSVLGVLLSGGVAAHAISGEPRQAAATQYTMTAATPTSSTPTQPSDGSGNAPGGDQGGNGTDDGTVNDDAANNQNAGTNGANKSPSQTGAGSPASGGIATARLSGAVAGAPQLCTTLIFLGSPSTEFEKIVVDGVQASVSLAGGVFASRAEIREPVKVSELASRAGSSYPDLTSSQLGPFSAEVGKQLLQPSTLFSNVRDTFFANFTRLNSTADGSPCSSVALAHESDTDLTGQKKKDLQAVYKGFINGLKATGLPVVGVEPKRDEKDSAIPFFKSYGVPSTVDNLDSDNGRVATSRLLRGAPAGNYGTGKEATSLLPPVAPVAVGG